MKSGMIDHSTLRGTRAPHLYDEQLQRQQQEKALAKRAAEGRPAFFAKRADEELAR